MVNSLMVRSSLSLWAIITAPKTGEDLELLWKAQCAWTDVHKGGLQQLLLPSSSLCPALTSLLHKAQGCKGQALSPFLLCRRCLLAGWGLNWPGPLCSGRGCLHGWYIAVPMRRIGLSARWGWRVQVSLVPPSTQSLRHA